MGRAPERARWSEHESEPLGQPRRNERARTNWSGLLFAVPTVGADLRRIDADRLDHALERLIAQRVEAHIFADGLEQAFSTLG